MNDHDKRVDDKRVDDKRVNDKPAINQLDYDPHDDAKWMRRACELARQGEGRVEPNPMVGCVLVRDGRLIAEGFHGYFGGPHAERVALAALKDDSAVGATAYVTLEPCCHHGKTPPCTDALIAAGIARVCCAVLDPFPQVSGRGAEQLRAAGIKVDVGCCAAEAQQILAPFVKRTTRGLPFVIAKWAMSLDGKIATHTSDSRWISSSSSRMHAHQVRSRMDAIIIGSGTALADDPQLTVRLNETQTLRRPLRRPLRVVVDSQARLPLTSRLVTTSRETPVLVWTSSSAPSARVAALRDAGCLVEQPKSEGDRLLLLLEYLAREQHATNVLVEGGGKLLGAFSDQRLIDEFQVYIAPKIIGGSAAITPIAGAGLAQVAQRSPLHILEHRQFESDLFIRARTQTDA